MGEALKAASMRVECRGDNFHLHFIAADGEELELTMDWGALYTHIALLRLALAAFTAESDLVLSGEGPQFERIARLDRVDSLARH
jgi:hypothetical protein